MVSEKVPGLRLIPIGRDVELILSKGVREFELRYAVSLGDAYELVQGMVQHTVAVLSGAAAPWGGYLAIDVNTTQVIGTCAFKGPPGPDGRAEIAYFTFPEFEGRGYATVMANELIRLAEASHGVRFVIAHTMPEENASTRVLKKVGMNKVGEVIDPEDGPVWAWQLDLETKTGAK